MTKDKQIEEIGYKRISKRAMAGVHPIILHIDCEAKCDSFFKRCEYCDLEKELLNRLADLEDKIEIGELCKASDVARDMIDILKSAGIDEWRYPVIAELKKKYTEGRK